MAFLRLGRTLLTWFYACLTERGADPGGGFSLAKRFGGHGVAISGAAAVGDALVRRDRMLKKSSRAEPTP